MIRRPPKSTRTDSLLPYPTLCRSRAGRPQAVITTNPPAATLARDRARDRERTGDDDKFHDECGVFGVFGHEDAAALAARGLHALQHRGQDSAGLVAFYGQHFNAPRDLGRVGTTLPSDGLMSRHPGHPPTTPNRPSTPP